MLFTPEELEELRRADTQIDADFRQTQEELRLSRQRDKAVKFDRLDNRGKRIAESQKAYYEANREKIAESQKVLLKNHRKNLGLSQRAYAEIIGVSNVSICLWESGKVPMNVDLISTAFPELGDALRKEDAASRCARPESGRVE